MQASDDDRPHRRRTGEKIFERGRGGALSRWRANDCAAEQRRCDADTRYAFEVAQEIDLRLTAAGQTGIDDCHSRRLKKNDIVAAPRNLASAAVSDVADRRPFGGSEPFPASEPNRCAGRKCFAEPGAELGVRPCANERTGWRTECRTVRRGDLTEHARRLRNGRRGEPECRLMAGCLTVAAAPFNHAERRQSAGRRQREGGDHAMLRRIAGPRGRKVAEPRRPVGAADRLERVQKRRIECLGGTTRGVTHARCGTAAVSRHRCDGAGYDDGSAARDESHAVVDSSGV